MDSFFVCFNSKLIKDPFVANHISQITLILGDSIPWIEDTISFLLEKYISHCQFESASVPYTTLSTSVHEKPQVLAICGYTNEAQVLARKAWIPESLRRQTRWGNSPQWGSQPPLPSIPSTTQRTTCPLATFTSNFRVIEPTLLVMLKEVAALRNDLIPYFQLQLNLPPAYSFSYFLFHRNASCLLFTHFQTATRYQDVKCFTLGTSLSFS